MFTEIMIGLIGIIGGIGFINFVIAYDNHVAIQRLLSIQLWLLYNKREDVTALVEGYKVSETMRSLGWTKGETTIIWRLQLGKYVKPHFDLPVLQKRSKQR